MNNETPIGVKALAYLNLKGEEKQIKEDIKEARVDIENYLEENGEETYKGHKIVTVEHAGNEVELKHELRVSTSPVPEHLELLEDILTPEQFERVTEKIVILREDVLESLVNSGEVEVEQLTNVFVTRESYAFKVKQITSV